MFRHDKFFWDKYLITSIAIGEGLSYTHKIPYAEREKNPNNESAQFLDFLAFELTAALPQYPFLQIVARIHHRSTAFTLFFHDKHAGSNNIGFAMRFYL